MACMLWLILIKVLFVYSRLHSRGRCGPRVRTGGSERFAHWDCAPVVPLSCRHLDALRWVEKEAAARGAGIYDVFNFGTGKGSTVFELVHAMERASGQKVLVEVGPRRPGDLTASYADPSKVSGTLPGFQ